MIGYRMIANDSINLIFASAGLFPNRRNQYLIILIKQ